MKMRWAASWMTAALVLVSVGWDACTRSRHRLEVSNRYGEAVDRPGIDPSSPTGYTDGRRSLILPSGGADTAHWIMQTQLMMDGRGPRLRYVAYDNAPAGREVHWAAPLRWWLGVLAWIDRQISGRPMGIAVERAILTSGPALFALFLCGITPLLLRRFSAGAAVVVAIGTVAAAPFYMDFLPGWSDHHGLANICGLLTVLFLLVGACSDPRGEAGQAGVTGELPTRRSARRWWVASAAVAGVGLWISAATQVPVLLAVGLAGLVASVLGRSVPERVVWLRDPELWRIWGWTGGGVSLLAYGAEYFPHHMALRLEVNHPLYAVAWVGAGELLRIISRALRARRFTLSTQDRLVGLIAGMAMVALPITLLVTAAQTFTVWNPLIWKLHTQYIAEFQSLGRHLFTPTINWGRLDTILPMLLLIPILGRLLGAKASPEEKALLALAAVPAVLGWLMGWSQVRWVSLGVALTFPAVAISFRMLRTSAAVYRWTIFAGVLLAPGLISAVQRSRGAQEITVETIQNLAERDLAHWLRVRAGDKPVVVAGGPGSTTKLILYGGVTGIGTLYWENAEGLKNAMELFGASSSDAAYALVQRLGVTHVVHFSWDGSEIALAKLQRGVPSDGPIPPDSFVAQLLGSPVPPPWLRELAFRLPDHPALRGMQIRLWEVTKPMQLSEAAVRAATNQLERGDINQAIRYMPLLARFKEDLPSSVMLAALVSRQGDAAGLAKAIERVLPQLVQAPGLGLEDHVNLVVVLTVAKQFSHAREQLRVCVGKVDEVGLRHLSPGSLGDLLALSKGLGVAFPDPELQRLAERLLSPQRR